MALLAGISKASRDAVIESARAAGRRGATRLPDSVLMATGDPSDSMIIERLDALEEGRAEREKPKPTYLQWLGENLERLMDQCIESGTDDGAKWVRQQYTIETGLTP
jgi:hypothetical protein